MGENESSRCRLQGPVRPTIPTMTMVTDDNLSSESECARRGESESTIKESTHQKCQSSHLIQTQQRRVHHDLTSVVEQHPERVVKTQRGQDADHHIFDGGRDRDALHSFSSETMLGIVSELTGEAEVDLLGSTCGSPASSLDGGRGNNDKEEAIPTKAQSESQSFGHCQMNDKMQGLLLARGLLNGGKKKADEENQNIPSSSTTFVDNKNTDTAEDSTSASSTYTYQDAYQTAKKATVGLVGGTMTAVGLVMIPLPTPFGVVIAGSGLAVLGTEFPEAQQVLETSRDTIVSAIENHVITDDDEHVDLEKDIGVTDDSRNPPRRQETNISLQSVQASSSLDDAVDTGLDCDIDSAKNIRYNNSEVHAILPATPSSQGWLQQGREDQDQSSAPIETMAPKSPIINFYPEHHDQWEEDGILYVPQTIKTMREQLTKLRKHASRTARQAVPILKSIGT